MTHHKNNMLCFEPGMNNATSRKTAGKAVFSALILSAVLPVVALSGCAKHSKDHFVVGSTPKNYKERHPIVLSEQEQTLDVPISSQTHALSIPAKSAVQGFTSNFRRSASGAITIMLPAGSSNSAAAELVGQKIARVIQSQGVSGGRISTVTYDASQHGSAAPIRLSYAAVSASVEKCGKWDRDLSSNKENRNYTNFGCASQTNLAAIVSNPADLLGPRGSTGIDPARRATVIEDYRESGSGEDFPQIFRTFGRNL